ncbi:uncharacterized protein LOC114790140 isoform X4 [Denticeps clupeoides]|uniref:uncharacterized protein LOC114790140 isoform X4 n=1 Tax=Denticeps clupeoides TaxID=299321 RepID=UPI0010A35AA4|nr:uncharacterized protein LOC114790140 isoform X4 [Denticeps clupeoides]XP_028835798.1 uncharacterized protein LOC114790140 isoform X4 [Denticeps clupeoides]
MTRCHLKPKDQLTPSEVKPVEVKEEEEEEGDRGKRTTEKVCGAAEHPVHRGDLGRVFTAMRLAISSRIVQLSRRKTRKEDLHQKGTIHWTKKTETRTTPLTSVTVNAHGSAPCTTVTITVAITRLQ